MVVGCEMKLVFRRKRPNPGTRLSASSTSVPGELDSSSLSNAVTSAIESTIASAPRVAVTTTVSAWVGRSVSFWSSSWASAASTSWNSGGRFSSARAPTGIDSDSDNPARKRRRRGQLGTEGEETSGRSIGRAR